jgi:hypothetical protein
MWTSVMLGNVLKRISKLQPKRVGCYKLQQHKPCFDKACSQLLDQKIQSKLQWLQNQNQMNIDNLNNIRNKISRGVNEFKNGDKLL